MQSGYPGYKIEGDCSASLSRFASGRDAERHRQLSCYIAPDWITNSNKCDTGFEPHLGYKVSRVHDSCV